MQYELYHNIKDWKQRNQVDIIWRENYKLRTITPLSFLQENVFFSMRVLLALTAHHWHAHIYTYTCIHIYTHTRQWEMQAKTPDARPVMITVCKWRCEPDDLAADAAAWGRSIDTQHTVSLTNLPSLTADWCVTQQTVIEACVLLLSQSGGRQLEQMEHQPG